jgi:hypothetical protein
MRVMGLCVLVGGCLWLGGCGAGTTGAGSGTAQAAGRGPEVLFFVLHDCPISNAYAPEVGRISLEYAARGVESRVVYVDEGVDASVLRRHAEAYGYPCATVTEGGRELARQFGVKAVPEAVVVRGEQVQYSGRIDDLYAELGKKRVAPIVRDLRDALDAVIEGRRVANPRVPAVGCTIEY